MVVRVVYLATGLAMLYIAVWAFCQKWDPDPLKLFFLLVISGFLALEALDRAVVEDQT